MGGCSGIFGVIAIVFVVVTSDSLSSRIMLWWFAQSPFQLLVGFALGLPTYSLQAWSIEVQAHSDLIQCLSLRVEQ